MSTDRIRALILLKINTQLLPLEEPTRLWAGAGKNEVCSVCDEPITEMQTVYEWEHAGGKIDMHISCFELWNTVRSR
jgi:hypothetical protein